MPCYAEDEVYTSHKDSVYSLNLHPNYWLICNKEQVESQHVDEESLPPHGGQWEMKMTIEPRPLAQISAYMAENRLKSAMEAENFKNMACEANVENSKNLRGGLNDYTTTS